MNKSHKQCCTKKVRHERKHAILLFVHKVKNDARLLYCITGQDSVNLKRETDWERSMEDRWWYLFVYLGGGLWKCVHCVKFLEPHTYDLCTYLICVVTKMFTKNV